MLLSWIGVGFRADPNELVGKRLAGRYGIDALVDETPRSLVYRATHLVWQRRVAIKVFKGASELAEDARAELLAGFVREGALLGELSEVCSTVCQARDVGSLTTSDGTWMPYMVLEWLEGEALDIALSRERASMSRPRTPVETVALLSPIAEALARAHARGIVHCDVKPGNIMLLGGVIDGEARCKLLDFGIAKVARDGPAAARRMVEFTPSYAAPEQFDPTYGPTGPWTDLYALALIVVEMVCSREAMEGTDVAALARAACDPGRRPSPRTLGVDVGERVELVLQRALLVRPEERFQDVRTFWAELSRAARRPAVAPRLDATMPFGVRGSRPAPARRPRRRSWLPAVLTAAIAVALAVGSGFAPPPRLADAEHAKPVR